MMWIRVGTQCHPGFVVLIAFFDELLSSLGHEAGGVKLLCVGCFINLPPLLAALSTGRGIVVRRENIFAFGAAF